MSEMMASSGGGGGGGVGGAIMSSAGTAFDVAGNLMAGKAAKKSAEYEAAQLRRAAGETRASGQREAEEIARQGDLALSDAIAVNAAGGGSANDLASIIKNITGTTKYTTLGKQYETDEQAKGLLDNAAAKSWEGKLQKKAYTIGAITSAIKGGNSMVEKFGSFKPSSSSTSQKPIAKQWINPDLVRTTQRKTYG